MAFMMKFPYKGNITQIDSKVLCVPNKLSDKTTNGCIMNEEIKLGNRLLIKCTTHY